MAARTNKINHDEKTKRLIRASQLLNRLTQFANGAIEMTQAQVNAARIVIAKAIPDLSAVHHTGDITHNYVARMPEVSANTDEWQKQHAPTIQ